MIHKNKLPYEKLMLRKHKNKNLKDQEAKEIRGLDTETLDGYCRLIASSTGAYREVESIDPILSFLTSFDLRGKANFWYNVQFDFDAIMKYMDKDELETLVLDHEIDYHGYNISYIPKKVFSIKRAKQTYKFFDLAQFYETSLENAALNYTSGVKNEDNLDRNLIGTQASYWEDNRELIIKYCIQDCKLTQELGEVLQDELYNVGNFYPKTYVSKASIAKQYFRLKCDIPSIQNIPKFALYYAYNSYHGGRFEVTERGHIGECTNIDLNSAYPYEITQLIDVSKGEWKRVDDMHEDAYYGFYLAEVDIPYTFLPPLAYDYKGTVIYPCGVWTAYFTKEELEAVAEIGSYKIIGGSEFYPTEISYPFRDAIQYLYDKKAVTPKSSYQYDLYKKIMNSLYGCFYEKFLDTDGLYKTGILFNPIYATLICANTRLKLWREANKYGKRCVSLATDGLLIRGELDYKPTKELGAWDIDKQGDSYIIRSGLYSVGEEIKQRGVMKSKYFHTPHGDYDNLFDYIRQYPNRKDYYILNNRPTHLSEAIRQKNKYTKEDINVFTPHNIAFNLNTDVKRIFDKRDITGLELLHSNIKSLPHYFENEL